MRNENRSTGQINVSFSLPALETMVRMRSTVDGVRVLRLESQLEQVTSTSRARHEQGASHVSSVTRHTYANATFRIVQDLYTVHSSIHTGIQVYIQYSEYYLYSTSFVSYAYQVPSYDI